jgi:hypothetical protein
LNQKLFGIPVGFEFDSRKKVTRIIYSENIGHVCHQHTAKQNLTLRLWSRRDALDPKAMPKLIEQHFFILFGFSLGSEF